MNDGSIRIIIGASMDRSVETVFSNIEKRAQKAGQTIGKSFSNGISGGGGSGGATKGFDAAAAASRKAEKQIEKDLSDRTKAAKAAAREMARDHEKSTREWVRADAQASREIIRQFKDLTRQRKRELEQQEADAKKAAQPSKFARNFGMYATRNLLPGSLSGIGAAKGIAGDFLRGAGIDMSVSGLIGKVVQMQSGSTYLANQERIATGSTRGGSEWNKISRNIGGKLSVDSNNVQDMIMAMTAKTGDFKGAAGMAEQLASLGTASGANLRDMGNAAGYVFNQMNKLHDGGTRTIEVMRGIVGQTAVGAVDMPDYAVQLGRIAANASKFQGDVGDNIREQSALAQLAVEAGGASSPADAARSVAAFSNTFGKHARIAAFAAHGVELFTTSNEEHRKTGKPQDTLRKASDIIKDSFKKTKGDIPALSIMFADTLGRKPVQALATAYKAAVAKTTGTDKEKETAGIKAIQDQIDKYMKATLDKDIEAKNIKDYQDSTAAKAIKFQNELEKIAAIAADTVFPALEKLAPMALSAADALGKLVGFAANNPGSAIALAIGASVANAFLQASVRGAMESAVSAAFGGAARGGLGLAGSVLGGSGEMVGPAIASAIVPALAAALAVATLTIGAVVVGNWLVDHADSNKPRINDNEKPGFKPLINKKYTDNRTVKTLDDLYSASTDQNDPTVKNSEANKWREMFTGAHGKNSKAEVDSHAIANGVTSGLKAQPLNVKVINMPGASLPGPVAPSHGRQSPAGPWGMP